MISIDDIRAKAKDLLDSGAVKAVIGYGRGTAGYMARPVFLSRPEEAEELTWDPSCVHNLALYLTEGGKCQSSKNLAENGPVAIFAKGCDSRGLVVLLQENYLRRQDIHVIGLSCEDGGVLDEYKLATALDGRTALHVTFADHGDFRVTTRDGEVRVKAQEVLADRCLECRTAHPVIHDTLFGEAQPRAFKDPFHALTAFEAEAKANGTLWAFWEKTMERCIRCYACRSVCPMCYCDECVVDSIQMAVAPDTTPEEKANRIKWIERSNTNADTFGYHLVRAMHLAGRCVDCGECERVCPVNIPLRLLNTKLEKEALDMFDYRVGFDADKPSLVSSFNDRDPNDFIR